MPSLVCQAFSLTGAVLVLVAYSGQQFLGMKPTSLAYGLLNLSGSLLIASTAFSPLNAGVLLLELSWAAISLNALIRDAKLRREGQDGPTPGL